MAATGNYQLRAKVYNGSTVLVNLAVNFSVTSGCSAPSPPSLSASPSTITQGSGSATLTATGCSGTVTWSHGLGTGSSKTVSPSSTTTYTATCTSGGCTSTAASVTVSVEGPPSGGCSAEVINGYGNSSENNTYTVSASGAGTYTVKINYARWESTSAATGSVKVNGGSNLPLTFAYTGGPDNYQDVTFTATLQNGNNTFQIFGGPDGYFKTRKVCIQSGAGGRIGIKDQEITASETESLRVFPNPNNGEFEVAFYLGNDLPATVTVISMEGKTLLERTVSGKGSHKEQIALPTHVSGTCLVLLRKSNGAEMKKSVVVR